MFDYIYPNSMIGRIVFAALLLAGTFIPDLDLKIPFLKHRGVFHTAWPVIFAAAAGIFLPKVQFLLFPFAIGYGSHLIADSITAFGVAPFFPLVKRRIKGPVKTGSFSELAIASVILAVLLIRGI